MTNAQSANDPNAELISQDGTFSMTNIKLPAEGATGPITVFRTAPFLGLSNDDTADGTEVIFEENDGSDSQMWKRTDKTAIDPVTGDSVKCFTLKNDLSTTFLTLNSDGGTLTACATCACSTDTACQSDNDSESLITYLMFFRYSRVLISRKHFACALLLDPVRLFFFF
jgi:hypothetical protein